MSDAERLLKNKIDPVSLEFRRLTAECSRGAFRCGENEIDEWFRDDALKHHDNMRLRTVTAHIIGENDPVGFYALTDHLEQESRLQGKSFVIFKRGGWFSTVRLGWLAVREDMQDQGCGHIIMGKVIRDFYDIVIKTGISALTLTAINERAARFYESLGFVRYGDTRSVRPDMLLPYQSAIELIEQDAC